MPPGARTARPWHFVHCNPGPLSVKKYIELRNEESTAIMMMMNKMMMMKKKNDEQTTKRELKEFICFEKTLTTWTHDFTARQS
jgi:hypothetical protein